MLARTLLYTINQYKTHRYITYQLSSSSSSSAGNCSSTGSCGCGGGVDKEIL